MLKKIFTIALITGAGQLFVVFALKYISQHSSAEQLKAIAQIDSLILFLLNIIALGLQPAAMRNIALTEDWKEEYNTTQSARITLGLILTCLVLLAFVNKYYLAFLIAPLLAWSGDYALYARGYPVAGAMIAFTRSIIPFSLLIVFTVYYPEGLAWVYFLAVCLSYVLTNLFISKILKISYFQFPHLSDLRVYVNTLPLGIVSLGLYFIGMGVILIAPYFYNDPVVAAAFIGLNFYVIFKGALRIIQQAFLKEMTRDEVCLKVDQLSSLLGLGFIAFMVCFPNTFINLFFGEKRSEEHTS